MVGRKVEPKALTHRPRTTTRNRTGNQTHTHTQAGNWMGDQVCDVTLLIRLVIWGSGGPLLLIIFTIFPYFLLTFTKFILVLTLNFYLKVSRTSTGMFSTCGNR